MLMILWEATQVAKLIKMKIQYSFITFEVKLKVAPVFVKAGIMWVSCQYLQLWNSQLSQWPLWRQCHKGEQML